MLTWIETQLQAILDTYKETNETTLVKVGVLNINALEKKFKDYLEEEQMLITYRELPGTLPNMPVFDRIINSNMYVYALENEKTAVEYIINKFISTYNATVQSSISREFHFTNLTPLGEAENTGALDYQAWQFGMLATVKDSLTSLIDRYVEITPDGGEWVASDEDYWDENGTSGGDYDVAGGDPTGTASTFLPSATELTEDIAGRVTDFNLNVRYYKVEYDYQKYNVTNGLVNYIFEKVPIYAEYPVASNKTNKKIVYSKPKITFAVLDNDNTDVATLKDMIYDESYKFYMNVVSKSNSKKFAGFILSAIDSITENGFPLLTFVIERG